MLKCCTNIEKTNAVHSASHIYIPNTPKCKHSYQLVLHVILSSAIYIYIERETLYRYLTMDFVSFY